MVDVLGWTLICLMFGVVIQYLATPDKPVMNIRQNVPLMAAVISINAMSLLDAMSTLFLVSNNYSREINPVMDALIQHSFLLFIAVKLSLTLVATIVCCYYYERKSRARGILKWTSRVYCWLMAWHCLLLTSVLL